jgi:hypothetical protein
VRRATSTALIVALALAGQFAAANTAEAPAVVRQEFGVQDGSTEASQTRIQLDIEYPYDGAVVPRHACGAFVSGRALALHLHRFDVIIVIDTSRSTADASGADINGNGFIGRARFGRIGSEFDMGLTDPGDSILAAEVAAALRLLRGFDPRSTRVGLVTFAGEPPGQRRGFFARRPRKPAVTLESLTNEYELVAEALNRILASEPEGDTHMAAGVEQATVELLGLKGALSQAAPGREKLVFFFTDGQATLPYGPGFEADNVRAVLHAANRAQRGGIRIHSYAIGPDALAGPIAVVEMAARTNGDFTPVRHPGDLVDLVEEVDLANLGEVRLRSATTGEASQLFRTTADGSWVGFVKMQPGLNEIEVLARAEDGTQVTENLTVRLDPDLPSSGIPQNLVVQRNRLLEDCLHELKRARLATKEKLTERVRKDLLLEIKRERAEANRRAAEQRKELQLEVVEGDSPLVD